MLPRPFFRLPAPPLAAGFAVLLAASLALPPAFANSYKRGAFSCDDFQEAERDYQANPTGGYAVGYALCLIARNQGEDVKALTILDSEIAKGDVSAARDKAVYIATGGTMKQSNLDDRYYNEALQAYGKVLLLINLKPDYPKGFEITEEAEQHELEAYTRLTLISYLKFIAGINGSDNARLLASPTYEGDRNLKVYPRYSPYTVDTLEKTIHYANNCANLPKKRHYNTLKHRRVLTWCRMVKKYGKELLSLERERLTLLNGRTCARDVVQCSEYQALVHKKMAPLIESREKTINKVWNTPLSELSN